MRVKINEETNKVERRFTHDWNDNSLISFEKLPNVIQVLLDHKKNMLWYIEELHDTIDRQNDVISGIKSSPLIDIRVFLSDNFQDIPDSENPVHDYIDDKKETRKKECIMVCKVLPHTASCVGKMVMLYYMFQKQGM